MQIKKVFKQRAPSGLVRIAEIVYNPVYSLWHRSLEILDEYGIVGPNKIYSNEYYEKRKRDPWRSDAHHLAEVLDNQFSPESVIDFGCAIGAHLEYWEERDRLVHGVEGSQKAIDNSVIPQEKIEKYDLRTRYLSDFTYELVMSIEVAEHLPEKHADKFVDSLTDAAGDTIVFTAATPGQGGTHHVNEQPRSYWINKFENRGFMYRPSLTESICRDLKPKNAEWLDENLFVFTC